MSERQRRTEQDTASAELLSRAASEYAQRRAQLQRLQTAGRGREALLGRLKLADGALVVVAAFSYVGHPSLAFLLAAAVAAFVALAVAHERILRSIASRERAERF